jgi:hypothetical protein
MNFLLLLTSESLMHDCQSYGSIYCLHLHINREDGGSKFIQMISNHLLIVSSKTKRPQSEISPS